MKKLLLLSFVLFLGINLNAQKLEDTRTYKKTGDVVSVQAAKYAVSFESGAVNTGPSAEITLLDRYNDKVGVLYFYNSANRSAAKSASKSDKKGIELYYTMDVFEGITDMLEDQQATIEFNTKTSKAKLTFGASSASAGGTTRPSVNKVGTTRPVSGDKKATLNAQKLKANQLKTKGTMREAAPR